MSLPLGCLLRPMVLKHLVVSFSQELTNDSYRLPLRGLPKLGSLAARVQVLGARW